MGEQEIVGYTTDDLAIGLEAMESSMAMGDTALITLCTESLPSNADLEQMYQSMIGAGFHLSHPTGSIIEGIPTTEFVLQKGSPFWPLLIPLIVPILTLGLITFGIFKLKSITTSLSNLILPILLVTLAGGIVIVALLRKPAEKYIERGGKIPLLPSTSKKAVAAR